LPAAVADDEPFEDASSMFRRLGVSVR